MLNCILLIIGFIMLIKGADVFVDNAAYIAKRFGIPSIIVGLTIVAIGTSAPEFSVSVSSALAGMPDMSVANVTGSIIFNLLCVLGISSLIGNLKIEHYRDIIVMTLSGVLLFILSFDGNLSFVDGLILLTAFIGYTMNLIYKSFKNNDDTEEECENRSMILVILMSILGLLLIVWGGNIVVDSASGIAAQLGMSENLIGLTVVAVGTSLPELVTSVVATKKGEMDIAIGNVIGSNIFNIILILGSVSVICPINIAVITIIDMICILLMFMVFIIFTAKDNLLNKWEGIVLILIYIAYIAFTIVR